MRGQVLRLNVPVELVTEECCNCGVIFGLTKQLKGERRDDHKNFYCPNGHPQHYVGESEAEKNARLLQEERERHQRTLQRENEERQKREAAERKLKRVNKGVCPECKRTFQNLARHMCTQHGADPVKIGKPKLP